MHLYFAFTRRDWLFGVAWINFGDTVIEIGFGPLRLVITTEAPLD